MEHKFIRQPRLEGKDIGKEGRSYLPDSCVFESCWVRFEMATADMEYLTFISSKEYELERELLCGSRKFEVSLPKTMLYTLSCARNPFKLFNCLVFFDNVGNFINFWKWNLWSILCLKIRLWIITLCDSVWIIIYCYHRKRAAVSMIAPCSYYRKNKNK